MPVVWPKMVTIEEYGDAVEFKAVEEEGSTLLLLLAAAETKEAEGRGPPNAGSLV